jgi:ribonuclease G
MARAKNRDQVLKTLRKALDEDRTKTYVVEVSPLGLVEMTRQNVTDGVREILTEKCPTCDGEGVVRSAETVAIESLRKLRDVVEDAPKPAAYLIRVNPKVARELMRHDSGLLELEEELDKVFLFEGGDALPIDTFEVAESGDRAEIERRALPFQTGDEVLLTIDEPHMYNPGDAVARVDALVITVTGAAPLVGQRKLVRIESIDRSSGVAELVDGVPEGSADGGDSQDSLESGSRRRGRRGGRRRSRAGSGSRPGTED